MRNRIVVFFCRQQHGKKPVVTGIYHLQITACAGFIFILVLLVPLPVTRVVADSDDDAKTCQPMQPSWLFCEDFEYGNLSAWEPHHPDGYVMLLPAPDKHRQENNIALRVRVPPGRGGKGLRKTFTLKDHKILHARWYVKYEPGFDFSARNHGHGFRAGDPWSPGSGHRPAGDDYFSVRFEHIIEPNINWPVNYLYVYYRGMQMDCSDPEGACWGDHFPCMVDEGYYCTNEKYRETVLPPVLEHDRWYCVELMADAGTPVDNREDADGRLDFRVDGRRIGPWEDLWLRTHAGVRINSFWLGLFHHDEHSKEGMMFDDIVISTQRIGCVNGPDHKR